jgi:hypothetical protein
MSEKDKKENQINVYLPPEIADGIYSNLAIISHSPDEFVIDFLSLVPGVQDAKVKSRIICTPQHAKKLLRALADNIQRYENSFGEIVEHEQKMPNINTNFYGEA